MPKTNPKTIELLKQKIAISRRELQEAYNARGYTDSVVLSANVKLDKLINQYQKLTNNTVPGSNVQVTGSK